MKHDRRRRDRLWEINPTVGALNQRFFLFLPVVTSSPATVSLEDLRFPGDVFIAGRLQDNDVNVAIVSAYSETCAFVRFFRGKKTALISPVGSCSVQSVRIDFDANVTR